MSSSRSTSPASFIRARRAECYKVNLKINPHIVDVISSSDLIPVIAPVGISRKHGHDDLYVADASLLCTAPGVNSQGSVMAFARRNALHFLGRL